MSAVAAAFFDGSVRENLRRWRARRPELLAALVVVVAWLVLIALTLGGASNEALRASTNESGAMPGMVMHAAPSVASAWQEVARALPGWVVMTTAMMGPVALGGVRHTALSSLGWRRRRAILEFSFGYLALWTAIGALLLFAVALVPNDRRLVGFGVTLLVAEWWQLTAAKQRFLSDCHRSVQLPPRGWQAERAALHFGLRHGFACAGACWCFMLVMAAAPGYGLLCCAALTVIVTAERLLERPTRAVQLASAALGIAALATFAVALA